jgi:hypothetical protein
MQINDANETHVADPSADDPELEVVASLDQPQERSPSAHAIGVAQSPADLPSSGESSLGAAVEELQGECHAKPDHRAERPSDEQQQVRMATAPTVLMHEEQQTSPDNTGNNRAVDMTNCSVQTDAVPPTDRKAASGSCPGHPIVASQNKEIEDLKKQIVRLEGALMRAAVNCNAEAKAVKSKTKTELAELRRRVYDQEDDIIRMMRQRNLRQALDMVLEHLSPLDLYAFARVSPGWSAALDSQPRHLRRLREFEDANKENLGDLFPRPITRSSPRLVMQDVTNTIHHTMGGSSSSGDGSSHILCHRTELQEEVTSQAPVEVKEGLTTRDSDQDSDEEGPCRSSWSTKARLRRL